MKKLERAFAIAVFSLALALGIPPATADVIAEESFVYTAGDTVNAQSGGAGWSGAWITGQPTAFVAATAIVGGPSIGATGGSMRVAASGRIFRVIDTSPGSAAALAGLVESHAAMFFGALDGIGVPGTTVWVGMLVSGGSGSSGDETQYHLYEGARTDSTSLMGGDSNKDGEVVAMLRGGNVAQWGFERTCNHSACGTGSADGYFATSPSVSFGGMHWSVTRLVFGATTTAITMWRDPTPGSVDPSDASALALTPYSGGTAVQTTIVPALHFNTIAPNANGNYNYYVDEIRIATTFAELGDGTVVGMPDAGVVGSDAGPSIDAGTLIDAAMPVDSGPLVSDAGSVSDGGVVMDATSGPDGGPMVSQPASCGCSTPGRAAGTPETVLLMLAAALLWRRPRRQS